jgi:hypothetical protein
LNDLPKVYGFVQHYQFTNLWGATSMKQHCKNGTSSFGSSSNTSPLLDDPIFMAVGMNTVFKLTTICNMPKLSFRIYLLKYDFDKQRNLVKAKPQENVYGKVCFAALLDLVSIGLLPTRPWHSSLVDVSYIQVCFY